VRIFLSYASEDRSVAERIRYALEACDHDVFFDRSDLAAGVEFDASIAQALKDSDLFIFLISPDSVEEGRYSRSELKMASQRWPEPSTYLLPVLVRPTPIDAIPPYLRAVSILEPVGDVGAETADAVGQLAARRGSRGRRVVIAATGLAIVIAVATAYWSLTRPSAGPPTPPTAARDPLLGQPILRDLQTRLRAVVAAEGGYAVALALPPEMRRMTDEHQQVGSTLPLPGEPVGVIQSPTQYLVMTRAPDAVVVVNRRDLSLTMTIAMDVPAAADGRRQSSQLISVAPAAGNVLWAVTADKDAAPALLKHWVSGWRNPTWMAGKRQTAADLGITPCHRLRTIQGAVWAVGGSSCTPGASVFRFEGAIRVDEYSPVDYPAIACASDLAENASRNVLFLSCTGELHEARLDGTKPVLERTQPVLPVERGSDTRSSELIATADTDVFVGINTLDSRPDRNPGRARIARVVSTGSTEIGRVPRASLISLAVSPRWVIAVLKNAQGSLEAVALPRH
jgi:TIR domain